MVLEIPPTWVSASNTTGVMSERRSSSSAAVSPAGPAPTTTATLLRPPAFMREKSRVHAPAVVEIPIPPTPRLCMTDRLKAQILVGDHEVKLWIGAYTDQTLARQRRGGGVGRAGAAVRLAHIRQERPIGIHERPQHFGPAANFERRRT